MVIVEEGVAAGVKRSWIIEFCCPQMTRVGLCVLMNEACSKQRPVCTFGNRWNRC